MDNWIFKQIVTSATKSLSYEFVMGMIVVSFSYGGCDGRVSSRSPHYRFCPGCVGVTRIKGDTFLPLYDEILITTVTGIVVSGRVFCVQALWNLLRKAISQFEVRRSKSENIGCTFVSQA